MVPHSRFGTEPECCSLLCMPNQPGCAVSVSATITISACQDSSARSLSLLPLERLWNKWPLARAVEWDAVAEAEGAIQPEQTPSWGGHRSQQLPPQVCHNQRLLAVGDESGCVTCIRTDLSLPYTTDPDMLPPGAIPARWPAHDNTIFDLDWALVCAVYPLETLLQDCVSLQ